MMHNLDTNLQALRFQSLRRAARCQSPVSGFTHDFYKYPARFSPTFSRAAIDLFSKPGDVVLDPFMGGGTTAVEGMLAGRQVLASDLNSLATFVAKVKTTPLRPIDRLRIGSWASDIVPKIRCHDRVCSAQNVATFTPKNMSAPQHRWLLKLLRLYKQSIDEQTWTKPSSRLAHCALLNVSQWAMNGRLNNVTATTFRARVQTTTLQLLDQLEQLSDSLHSNDQWYKPTLIQADAADLPKRIRGRNIAKADLIVTSPPYPGVHMLYHRWQVDGRRETDAPYWITGTEDGQSGSYYTFASRYRRGEEAYFERATRTYSAIRSLAKANALLIQMVGFSNPRRQRPKFLQSMSDAGFTEVIPGARRITRSVPGRNWHANSKGQVGSSREYVLVHKPT